MKRHGLILVLVLMPVVAFAQGPAVPALDADRLPVSIARIKEALAQAPASTQTGLRLQYYIEVYGRSIPLDISGDFDLRSGPVPYGGPTHRELIGMVTPQEFRAPAADLLGPARLLLGWLSEKTRQKTRPAADR
jgi:hypothetical protein